MFHYCPKCANIKNVSLKKNQNVFCELCETEMKPVPEEYLMPNGSFFKSQADRQELISVIQSLDTYDGEISRRKEEIQRTIVETDKKRVTEINEKMRHEQFHMTCPVCQSHNVQKISTVGKYAKVSVLGILGADDLGKTWKCKVCGCKF